MTAKTNIYCLLCQDNKYYVGKATNIANRFHKHYTGNGSLWTRLHPPIEIVEIRHNVSPFEEDKMVKEYMLVYGINNVRGGSYIQTELNSCQIYNLQRELRTASDKCFQCGGQHFCRNCKLITVDPDFWLGVFIVLAVIIAVILARN